MQLVNPNYLRKNGVEQIKKPEEKLSYKNISFPHRNNEDRSNRVKTHHKFLRFLLKFVVFLNGFYLFLKMPIY